MKNTTIAVAVLTTLTLAACGKTPPPPPPSPPPAAPQTPPPATPPPPTPAPEVDEYTKLQSMSSEEIDRLGLLQDIHFDFDKSDIREVDRPILTKNADVLKKFDFITVTVEGHCDERGTADYNIALGDRRAKAAADYLISLGVLADRVRVVSYGKEVPLCTEATEECWARNRRARTAVTGKTTN